MKIVCFGPGPKFKGGISNYNTSLAKALDKIPGTEVHIVSWTQQYPAIIPREFIDKSSRMDLLEGSNIKVKYITNYNNPLSWYQTYQYILSLKPDKVIFQWAIAIQGLPIGRIVGWLRHHPEIEVILDLHFVIQKENSSIDQFFTKLGIGKAKTYIVHALKTYQELQTLYPQRQFQLSYDGQRSTNPAEQTVLKLYHPIYDLFQPKADFDIAAFKQAHGLRKHVFLFFGFIRKYKGLHHVIPAFQKVAAQRDDVSLLICGESFWQTLDNTKLATKIKNALFGLAKKVVLRQSDDERQYNPLALIDELQLRDRVAVFNTFIPNEDVHKYFQVADCVVLFYEYATPSGIESLSYNFALPLVATKVGHFPETIQHGYSGYLAEAGDIDSMAEQMLHILDAPIPRENIRSKTAEMSWDNYAKVIIHTK
ncbi:glycosyltransferase [Haliscomenobacter hydrossis]|uniref:Glycosyl transferase group 1 n=1 Tax=Haliscomenobacter hydrossis (strain ATCC 27775 / DSM 1100 / LMG 10767 / O) TaxID=760192 RepID=F4L6G0_HALH1|nr:glycosyltransferase [Haliscomenobacter hydrossis]AEE48842.1 glycosyl transferase group 1 [Haliscomenobacter hydrossis DSM 1100]